MVIDDEIQLQSRDIRKKRIPGDFDDSKLLRQVRAAVLQSDDDEILIVNVARSMDAPVPDVRACFARLVRDGLLGPPTLNQSGSFTYLGRKVTYMDSRWRYEDDWIRKSTGVSISTSEAIHGPYPKKTPRWRTVPSDRTKAKQSRKVTLRPCSWNGMSYPIELNSKAFTQALKHNGFPHPRSEWTCKCSGNKNKIHPFSDKKCHTCGVRNTWNGKEKEKEPAKPPPPVPKCAECDRPLEFKVKNGKKMIRHPKFKCRNNRVQDVLDL